MDDLNDFFSKKLTMKEIDAYLNDNKMNFNHTEHIMESGDKKAGMGKSGVDYSKEEDSYGDEEDDYGAEDIIKELLKEGYFNDLAKKESQNDVISEKSQEQEEEEDKESSEDSIVEVNRQKGYNLGFKGSRILLSKNEFRK